MEMEPEPFGASNRDFAPLNIPTKVEKCTEVNKYIKKKCVNDKDRYYGCLRARYDGCTMDCDNKNALCVEPYDEEFVLDKKDWRKNWLLHIMIILIIVFVILLWIKFKNDILPNKFQY